MGKARDLANLIANGGITTTSVLSATAGASLGAVGTYALLQRDAYDGTASRDGPGTAVAGSNLVYINASGSRTGTSLTRPSGTWVLFGDMSTTTGGGNKTSVFLRIS